jgi:Flp pilus assembly protein TadD
MNAPSYYRRALALALLGRWPSADADCQKFLAMRPDDLPAHYLSGQILLHLGRERDATRQFARAVQLEPGAVPTSAELEQSLAPPTNPAVLNDRAWQAVRSPHGSQPLGLALLDAQRAVTLAPDNGYYHNTLGVAYYRLGRCREAIASLSESMRLSEGTTKACNLYFLAMCHARLQEFPAAAQAFDKADVLVKAQKKVSSAARTELADSREEAQAVLRRSQPGTKAAE